MHVSREQYVQFLYNATLPFEERPGAKQPQPQPKPEVKPEVKPDPKRFANCKKQTMRDIMTLQEIARIMVSI